VTSRHSHRAAGEILSGSEAVSSVRTPALAPHPAPSLPSRSRRPKGWGRKLSARKVGKLIEIGQVWSDRKGARWTVANLYRPDRVALLQGRGRKDVASYVTLGADYRLEQGS
jgi:hypothetical protein